MNSEQQTARIAGIWFVITFVASIPALLLYAPVLDHADYILGRGADTRISVGAFLEIILAIANIATAVVLFPILKRRSESIAIGYVTLRVVESTVIVIGLISLLSVMTLRQDVGGVGAADGATLTIAGRSLVAVHDWTFLIGPQLCAGFGTGLLLGYLMYTSGLVPRRLALVGLIGGPLAFAAGIPVLFGVYDLPSAPSFLLTIPEIVWEGALGIWLIVKGFNASAVSALAARQPRIEAAPAASSA